jgi:hypothetical protein
MLSKEQIKRVPDLFTLSIFRDEELNRADRALSAAQTRDEGLVVDDELVGGEEDGECRPHLGGCLPLHRAQSHVPQVLQSRLSKA